MRRRILLKNYATGEFERFDYRSTNTGTQHLRIQVPGDPYNYINHAQGHEGEVQTRVPYYVAGIVTNNWHIRIDQAVWRTIG